MISDDERTARLRGRIDDVAPPISLSEVQSRSVPRLVGRHRPLVVAASLVILVGVAISAVVAISTADAEEDVRAGQSPSTAKEASSSTTSAVPLTATMWPEVLSAFAQRPEVLLSSLATGEVNDRFAPPGLADGELTGAVGSSDGRIAAWSGAEVAVRADGVTYERALVDPTEETTVAGSFRVLFVPAAAVVWIVPSPGAGSEVLQWNYVSDELSRTDVVVPADTLPAGVDDDGRLVLSSDPLVGAAEDSPGTTVVGPELSSPPVTFEGSVLAIGSDAALVRRCDTAENCSLVAVELAGGEAAEVAAGDVDPAMVRSLIGPTVPFDSAPLPTGHPGSGRVLVGLEVGPQVSQDQPTKVAIVDLERLSLEVPPGSPENVTAAAWSCDGSNIAVLGSDGVWRSLAGALDAVTLPDGTFLYGLGGC